MEMLYINFSKILKYVWQILKLNIYKIRLWKFKSFLKKKPLFKILKI